MARLLLLTLVFPPDSVSTAHLMGDLAEDLVRRGHRVTVLTTTPHYNRDPERERGQPLARWCGRLVQTSCFKDIPVYHVLVSRKGRHPLLRLMSWTGLHAVSLLVGLLPRFRADVVLAPSPPLSMGLCAAILARWSGGKSVYNIQELYPDLAINQGALRNRWLILAARLLERLTYRANHHLVAITDGMRECILAKGLPLSHVSVIPNCVDTSEFRPLPRANAFSSRHGLDGSFVVSYAGNMGVCQELETFVRAAHKLRDRSPVRFVMLGDGTERGALLDLARTLGLGNLTYLGYLPYSQMPEAYSACELSLVAQSSGIGHNALPSKLYRILAAERAVLACGDPDGDLLAFVRHEGVGLGVPAGDAQAMADAIDWAQQHPIELARMATAGRHVVVERFSREAVAAQYDHLLRDLSANAPTGGD